MTITINLSPELEQQVRETSAARGIPAEDFVLGVVSDSIKQAQVPPLSTQLSPEESRLFAVINEGLSESEWQRFRTLNERRREETLTEIERMEFIAITTRLEQLNVQRLEKLIELARRRGVTVDQLMHQLGIRPPAYE